MCVCENYEFGFLQVEKVYMKTWMLELHMRSTKNHMKITFVSLC